MTEEIKCLDSNDWKFEYKKCLESIEDAKETIVELNVFLNKCSKCESITFEDIFSMIQDGLEDISCKLNKENKTFDDISIIEAVHYILHNSDIYDTNYNITKLHDYGRYRSKLRVYKSCVNSETFNTIPKYDRLCSYLNAFS